MGRLSSVLITNEFGIFVNREVQMKSEASSDQASLLVRYDNFIRSPFGERHT
jgi:hypothetical protein